MAVKLGLAAAIEAAAEARTPVAADGGAAIGGESGAGEAGDQAAGRQLSLLADETGGGTEDAASRGAGRPPGTPNRRTTRLRDWILAKGYRHPAIVLAELASAKADVLATALQCKRAEAQELIRKSAVDLMPYMEQKMPVAVELPDDAERPMLLIGEVTARRVQAIAAGALGLDDPVEDIEPDQGVSDAAAVRPGGEGSHDAG